MTKKKYIYDIHYHAFDLSHANLSAFLRRLIMQRKQLLNENKLEKLLKKYIPRFVKFLVPLVPYRKLSEKIMGGLNEFVDGRFDEIANTLAVFENPIEDHFLIIEYFLKQNPEIIKDNKIVIGDDTYDKLVICPLMIDFGQKTTKLNFKGHYNRMPGKPIVKQTIDLFNAIKNYYKYELVLDKETDRFIRKEISDPTKKPMLILPFLGLNPENYKAKNGDSSINSLFKQYFDGYNKDTKETRMDRAEKSIEAFLKFEGKLTDDNNKDKNLLNMFFGVKLYPPLGFDPSKEINLELFDLCIKNNIPITTHCSDSGFVTETQKNQEEFTSPLKHWNNVLTKEKYTKLKLNYAHFGIQGHEKTEWKQKIVEHMNVYPNVYSDISSLAQEKSYYKDLTQWLSLNDKSNICNDRLLFGSDFIINLLESSSYNQYLENLKNCNEELKENICIKNPENFLFN